MRDRISVNTRQKQIQLKGESMSHTLKSIILCSGFFAVLFVAVDFKQLEAATGRWGAYDNERAAWGGNGGWWGGGENWYGDHPQEHYSSADYYRTAPHYSDGYNNNYYYDNNYPYGQQYYSSPGFDAGAGAGVDGAGVYFNIR